MKLLTKIIKGLKTVQSSTFSSSFTRLALLTKVEGIFGGYFSEWLGSPQAKSFWHQTAFALRKPPDGSLSNRAEAPEVGLEHAGGITYPIWPWKM